MKRMTKGPVGSSSRMHLGRGGLRPCSRTGDLKPDLRNENEEDAPPEKKGQTSSRRLWLEGISIYAHIFFLSEKLDNENRRERIIRPPRDGIAFGPRRADTE